MLPNHTHSPYSHASSQRIESLIDQYLAAFRADNPHMNAHKSNAELRQIFYEKMFEREYERLLSVDKTGELAEDFAVEMVGAAAKSEFVLTCLSGFLFSK